MYLLASFGNAEVNATADLIEEVEANITKVTARAITAKWINATLMAAFSSFIPKSCYFTSKPEKNKDCQEWSLLKRTFTSYGLCFTFNSDRGDGSLPVLIQRKAGMGNGLKLVIDQLQDDSGKSLGLAFSIVNLSVNKGMT